MTYVQKRAQYTLNKNNPSSATQVSLKLSDLEEAFQGSTARKVERRSMERSTPSTHILTPVDQRVAELSSDLNHALEASARQSDRLVAAQRELDVKDQQLEKLQADLAIAKEKLGIANVCASTVDSAAKNADLHEQQKDVIDVLDELVQEGNRGFRSIYCVLDPLKRMLSEGHSVIVNKNNGHGEGLLGLTDILDDYAEKYQQSLLSVEGKIADA